MGSRSGTKTFLVLLILGALALIALAGCAEIRVVDATPSVVADDVFSSPLSLPVSPPGAGANPEHNLAVVAVEFDPPLDRARLLQRRQPITLVVAIENRGSQTERDVTVLARLSIPGRSDFLLAQDASTGRIAPGEIQVVRFPPLTTIPLFDAYFLEVIIDALPGERDLDDNRKAFDIQVRQRPGPP